MYFTPTNLKKKKIPSIQI